MSAAKLFAGSVSSLYAKVRPTVSPQLVEKVVGFLDEKASPPHKLAVDIGCGTGLNTPFFTPYFKKFVGLDVSSTQIDQARKDNKISNASYDVNDSTKLPFANNSVDLITVIQTAHWLDHGPFFKECDRILKSTGVVALLGYSVPGLSYNSFPRSRSKLNDAVRFFYDTLVRTNSWHADRYILDRLYRDINLPYKDQIVIRNDPELYLYKEMTIGTFIDYLSTWSGYREYEAHYPRMKLLEETKNRIFAALPGQVTEDTVVTAIFPWFLLMCRKGSEF